MKINGPSIYDHTTDSHIVQYSIESWIDLFPKDVSKHVTQYSSETHWIVCMHSYESVVDHHESLSIIEFLADHPRAGHQSYWTY